MTIVALNNQMKLNSTNLYSGKIFSVKEPDHQYKYEDIHPGLEYYVSGILYTPAIKEPAKTASREFKEKLVYMGDSFFRTITDNEPDAKYYQVFEFGLLDVSNIPTIYNFKDTFLELTDQNEGFGLSLESVKGFFDIGCKFEHCVLTGCSNAPSKLLTQNNIYQLVGSLVDLTGELGLDYRGLAPLIQCVILKMHYIQEVQEDLYLIKFDSTDNIINRYLFVHDLYGLINSDEEEAITELVTALKDILEYIKEDKE